MTKLTSLFSAGVALALTACGSTLHQPLNNKTEPEKQHDKIQIDDRAYENLATTKQSRGVPITLCLFIILAILFYAIVAPVAIAADQDEKLQQLRIGVDDRDRVVGVMGKPSSETQTNTLGVSRTRMTWTSMFSSRTYGATLIWGRLISVQVCQSTKDCE